MVDGFFKIVNLVNGCKFLITSAEFQQVNSIMATVREKIAVQVIGENSYSGRGSVNARGAKLRGSAGGKSPIYGGQVIGQALSAATRSMMEVDSNFVLSSFHCYFISPTLDNLDIVYKVQRLKEGKTFCSLTVAACQVSDRTTFKLMASFDKLAPAGNAFDMETKCMPIVPHPDRPDDPVDSDYKYLIKGKHFFANTPAKMWGSLNLLMCFTAKEIEALRTNTAVEARHIYWIKANSGYSQEDHQNYHRCVLAFASDWLAGCVTMAFPNVQVSLMTSLDHSLWFHSDCDSQKWHLHVVECDHSKGGRTLNSIWIYSEDGTLVASGKQDALCRPKL